MIQVNHEFLADQAVLHRGAELLYYKRLLIGLPTFPAPNYMASNINFQVTKKRLKMMNKESSTWRTAWLACSALPLIMVVMLIFGNPIQAQDKKKAPSTELMDAYYKNAKIHVTKSNGSIRLMDYEDLDAYWRNKLPKPEKGSVLSKGAVVFLDSMGSRIGDIDEVNLPEPSAPPAPPKVPEVMEVPAPPAPPKVPEVMEVPAPPKAPMPPKPPKMEKMPKAPKDMERMHPKQKEMMEIQEDMIEEQKRLEEVEMALTEEAKALEEEEARMAAIETELMAEKVEVEREEMKRQYKMAEKEMALVEKERARFERQHQEKLLREFSTMSVDQLAQQGAQFMYKGKTITKEKARSLMDGGSTQFHIEMKDGKPIQVQLEDK